MVQSIGEIWICNTPNIWLRVFDTVDELQKFSIHIVAILIYLPPLTYSSGTSLEFELHILISLPTPIIAFRNKKKIILILLFGYHLSDGADDRFDSCRVTLFEKRMVHLYNEVNIEESS